MDAYSEYRQLGGFGIMSKTRVKIEMLGTSQVVGAWAQGEWLSILRNRGRWLLDHICTRVEYVQRRFMLQF